MLTYYSLRTPRFSLPTCKKLNSSDNGDSLLTTHCLLPTYKKIEEQDDGEHDEDKVDEETHIGHAHVPRVAKVVQATW